MRQLIIAVVVFEIQQCKYEARENIKLAIRMNSLIAITIILIVSFFLDLTRGISTRSWCQHLLTLPLWQFGTLYYAYLRPGHSSIDRGRGDALRRQLIHIIMRYWLFFEGFNREWRNSIEIFNWELREGTISSVLPWFCQRIGFYATKVMTSNRLQQSQRWEVL